MFAAWAGWAILKKFAPLIIGVLVLVTVWGAVMGYGRTRYNQGVTATEAKFAPKLLACATDRDAAFKANKDAEVSIQRLKAAYGDLEIAVKQLEARERVARLRGERIAAELAKKEREFIQEALRLRAIIDGPRAATREEACAGAEVLLTEEARARSGRIKQ
jgi:hypothetical protein